MIRSIYFFRNHFLALLLVGFSSLILSSCGSEATEADGEGTVAVHLIHRAGNNLLQGDADGYKLGLGNVNYSVEKLSYYLSSFELINTNGERVSFPTIALVDAVNKTVLLNTEGDPTEDLRVDLSKVPQGSYSKLSFVIGLNESDNQTGALPNLTDHLNMAWPEPMGGGYHYMKFEGRFTDSQGQTQTFATHTGRLSNSVKVEDYYIPVTLTLDEPIVVTGREAQSITVAHDADEWFANPNNNALQDYPRMIMGNHEAQEVFRQNGNSVFYLPL